MKVQTNFQKVGLTKIVARFVANKLLKYSIAQKALFLFGLAFLQVPKENRKSDYCKNFFVVVTVDVEPGYVDTDGSKNWHAKDAFEGYIYGLQNLLALAKKHNVKFTFLLDTHAFSAKGKAYRDIVRQLKQLLREGHELGFHLHPKDDLALQKKLGKKFDYTCASFYNTKEIVSMLKAGRELIREHLGHKIEKEVVSFRWGNWGLSSQGVKALARTGFRIDTSSCPGIKRHQADDLRCDWTGITTTQPWLLNSSDLKDTLNGNSVVMEIPIATATLFNKVILADPNYSTLLQVLFRKHYYMAQSYHNSYSFVVFTHSNEATLKDGQSTPTLQQLDNFLNYLKDYNYVKVVPLHKAGQILRGLK
ncbi:MAG: hypothetical protein V1837_04700 [Candidatus Woesearchaeota archaeon]